MESGLESLDTTFTKALYVLRDKLLILVALIRFCHTTPRFQQIPIKYFALRTDNWLGCGGKVVTMKRKNLFQCPVLSEGKTGNGFVSIGRKNSCCPMKLIWANFASRDDLLASHFIDIFTKLF
jgi:hypothetical protein